MLEFDQTIDKGQVPPLHQKRIVAFVNHFLISSSSFLNEFAKNCESKLIELERKIQRLEAGLTVIEAKLSSIPEDTFTTIPNETELTSPIDSTEVKDSTPKLQVEAEIKDSTEPPPNETVVRACEDVRYRKYFKMLHFGVPPNAVKLKMQAEGVDPRILDTPNLELPDAVTS